MPSYGLKYEDLHMYLNIAHRFVLQSIIVLASDIQLLYMHITVEIETNNISTRHLSSCVCMNNFVSPFPEQQVMNRGANYVLALSNITLKSYHNNQVISTSVAMAGGGKSGSSLLRLEASKCDNPVGFLAKLVRVLARDSRMCYQPRFESLPKRYTLEACPQAWL